VLTDSVKKPVDDDDQEDEEEEECSNVNRSPAPPKSSQPKLQEARSSVEVYHHHQHPSLLPPPALPPRDHFLNTPIYYSSNGDNFLQTPVHPFNFTEEEIEQELRSHFKTPNAAALPSTRLLTDAMLRQKLATPSLDSPPATPATPATSWGLGHSELNVDLSRTPRASGSSQQSSPPSTQVASSPLALEKNILCALCISCKLLDKNKQSSLCKPTH
jgi:hypothetical protein